MQDHCNDAITLYAYPFRSRAERVVWTMEELGLSYQVIRLDPMKGELNREDFIALNPDKKLPILVHQGKVLLESLAIMEYLNALAENGRLVPHGTAMNYEFRRILHYGLTEIEPYLWLAEQANGSVKHLYHWPEEIYSECISTVVRNCSHLTAWLNDKDYLVENIFTLADIYFYHILTWARQHGIEFSDTVEEYLGNLEQRPNFPASMNWR